MRALAPVVSHGCRFPHGNAGMVRLICPEVAEPTLEVPERNGRTSEIGSRWSVPRGTWFAVGPEVRRLTAVLEQVPRVVGQLVEHMATDTRVPFDAESIRTREH
jgi:hypothetical protein